MSKPDWKDAPPQANFVAMDASGLWYWYESKPLRASDYWYPETGLTFHPIKAPIENWQDTLEPRP